MKNLAILSPSNDTLTETFITAHRKLPFNVTFLHGGLIPFIDEKNNKPIVKVLKIFFQIISKIRQKGNYFEPILKFHLKRNKIDIVLAEFGVTGAESLNVIKKLKLPLIVHFHGFDASVYDVLKEYNEKYKEMFLYAKSVIAVSKTMKAKLIEIGCPEEKICLNTYGPHPDFFNVKPNLNNKNFLSVGRFVDKKAPYFTILAFNDVIKKHQDANLVMIGDGPLLATCKNLVTYFKLEKNISFVGAKNREEIVNYLNNSIGFIQHSIQAENGDSEGTPVAIIEAQAAGIPVISTLHAGIPEVVIHGKTGYLVKERSVNEMAAYICSCIEQKEVLAQLSINSKENIKKNYSLENHLNTITGIINRY